MAAYPRTREVPLRAPGSGGAKDAEGSADPKPRVLWDEPGAVAPPLHPPAAAEICQGLGLEPPPPPQSSRVLVAGVGWRGLSLQSVSVLALPFNRILVLVFLFFVLFFLF